MTPAEAGRLKALESLKRQPLTAEQKRRVRALLAPPGKQAA